MRPPNVGIHPRIIDRLDSLLSERLAAASSGIFTALEPFIATLDKLAQQPGYRYMRHLADAYRDVPARMKRYSAGDPKLRQEMMELVKELPDLDWFLRATLIGSQVVPMPYAVAKSLGGCAEDQNESI